MVTTETLAAIMQRVEATLYEVKDKIDRLDSDVRANFVRRDELKNYVSLDRYVWVERIVMGMAGMILIGALVVAGTTIWNAR